MSSGDDSEVSGSSSEPPPAERPNKFTGSESTWRRLTADDRLVYNSMNQLRDQDLSIHLYNAHSLKRQLYDPVGSSVLKSWASKDRWRTGEDLRETERFVPMKTWTAWPLDPGSVPKLGEGVKHNDGADSYTLKRPEKPRPSRELEAVLTGMTVRIAKETFEGREWASESAAEDLAQGDIHQEILVESDSEFSGQTDGFESILDDEEVPVVPLGTRRTLSREGSLDVSPKPKQVLQKPLLLDEKLNPIVSADDERSRDIIRPSIRHIMTELDRLLMSLHHGRQTCLRYGSEGAEDFSEDGFTSKKSSRNNSQIRAPVGFQNKKVGQPRKGVVRPSDIASSPVSNANDGVEDDRPAKRGRGRPRKTPRDESENNLQQNLPNSSPNTTKRSSRSRSRGISPQSPESRQMALGLRDWSEVLGTAALVGFSPDVIARTAQRCSTLFGEGMEMYKLADNPISGWKENEVLRYVPDDIPPLDNLEDGSVKDFQSSSESPQQKTRAPKRRKRRASTESRNIRNFILSDNEAAGQFHCHFRDCIRYGPGFAKKQSLELHLRGAHGLSGKELKDAMADDHEKMDGAVHVDGFMQTIKRRKGHRGKDKSERERKTGKYGNVRSSRRRSRLESKDHMQVDREMRESKANTSESSEAYMSESESD